MKVEQCGDCLKYYSNAQPVILLACLSFTDLFVDKTKFFFCCCYTFLSGSVDKSVKLAPFRIGI